MLEIGLWLSVLVVSIAVGTETLVLWVRFKRLRAAYLEQRITIQNLRASNRKLLGQPKK